MIEVEDVSDDPTNGEIAAAQTRTARDMREEADMDLRELIESLGGTEDVEFRVYRRAPKMFEGIAMEGHLETFHEMVTEEELKRRFGGGTYQVKIFRPNARGAMVHFKAKSVKIPGNPDMTHYRPKKEEEPPAFIDYGGHESDTLAAQALSTMKELVDKKQDGGFNPAFMQAITAPLQAQIQSAQEAMVSMQRSMADKDAKILELLTQKPDTSAKDDLVNKMFDTEANRTNSLREMHASEMRQLRENHREDMKRVDDRHKEDLRSREEGHKREIDNLQRSMQAQIDSNKVAYEARVDGLKSEIERLNRDLTVSQTEVTELRAKKEKSLPEQAAELSGIAESFKALGIIKADEGEDNSKWYEKLIGAAAENPELLQGLLGPPASPPQQLPNPAPSPAPSQAAVQGVPPVGQPFQTEPGGPVFVRTPDDQIVPWRPSAPATAPAAAAAPTAPKPPSPSEVKIAIGFIETAFRNGTPAEAFAISARSAIPGDILAYLEAVGVDEFLNSVARLEQGSPLRNQAGREYVREVGRFLLEGATSNIPNPSE